MRLKTGFMLMMIILVFANVCNAGQNPDNILDEQINALNLDSILEELSERSPETSKYLESTSLKDYLFVNNAEPGVIDITGFLKGLLAFAFRELVIGGKLLGQLIVLAVFFGVLEHFYEALAPGKKGNFAYAVCLLALIAIAADSLSTAMITGKKAIDDMTSFMLSLMPPMLTLLSAAGGLASTAVFSPIMLALITVTATIMKSLVFPLVLFSSALGMIGNMSDRVQVNRFTDFVGFLIKIVIGFTSTLFLGVTGIYGITLPISDGLGIRFARFFAGNLVPVVGNLMQETLHLVAGGSLLIRNALGMVGMVAVCGICIFPAIKIMSMALIYRVASALVQPVSGSRLSDVLNIVASSLTNMFAAVAVVGLAFFLGLLIMIGIGNMTIMVR
jgi:stage III sporulation protein AE